MTNPNDPTEVPVNEIRHNVDPIDVHDPSLVADRDELRRLRADGPSPEAFARALEIRKALAADTLAPDALRALAAETVEAVRPGAVYCECETPTIDLETEAGCHRCGRPIDFSPLATLRRRLRPGWFLREGTSKAPRGYLALEYGLETTTATRTVVAAIAPEDADRTPELYPEAFEDPTDATLCTVHEPGACYEGCPDAYDLSEEPTDETPTAEETAARERQQTLFGAARGLVALARSLHTGDGDPMDDLVLALARSSGGEYALLAATFRLLDSEEELDAEKRLANWTSYGTETQYAMMRRVARGVVGNANGARETFADIVHATSERAGSVPPVRLAEERRNGLDSISERDSIYTARRAARAEAIAAGATYDEASAAWSAAMALDHPKGGRS